MSLSWNSTGPVILVESSWHPRMSMTSRACRARWLWKTTPTHGQTGSAIQPAFDDADTDSDSPDTPICFRPTRAISLRWPARGCHEDATRKTVPWNLSFNEQTRWHHSWCQVTSVCVSWTHSSAKSHLVDCIDRTCHLGRRRRRQVALQTAYRPLSLFIAHSPDLCCRGQIF